MNEDFSNSSLSYLLYFEIWKSFHQAYYRIKFLVNECCIDEGASDEWYEICIRFNCVSLKQILWGDDFIEVVVI